MLHRWTHWRFPCFFCKYVLSSVTCTVGRTGVFRVFFYILFDAVLHGSLDTLTFTVVLYTLFRLTGVFPIFVLFDPL